MVDGLKQTTLNNQSELQQVKQSITDMQAALEKSKELSAEQEKIIAEWQSAQKGNLNKWYVAEAQYLIKLANDNLQFNQNYGLALILLQRATQTLQNLQSDTVLDIQKSLASDIANLQPLQQIDMTQLYLKLTALTRQINQLPLPIDPLNMKNEHMQTSLNTSSLPWWEAGLHYSLEALRKIVIVRRYGNQSLPLVLPEEKNFLYQNLHAQLEDAMWALLHRDANIYQASLGRAQDWTKEYFDQNASLTKNVLQQIQILRAVNIQLPNINFSQTLQLIDNYLSQPENKTV